MNWEKTRAVLSELGIDIITKYKEGLTRIGAVASGRLRDSTDWEIRETPNGLALYFITLDYWIFVEAGRAPGKQPPISAILPWLITRGINNKASAFAIARTIGKRGIKARPVLGPIMENLNDDIINKINQAIAEDIADIIKERLYEHTRKN